MKDKTILSLDKATQVTMSSFSRLSQESLMVAQFWQSEALKVQAEFLNRQGVDSNKYRPDWTKAFSDGKVILHPIKDSIIKSSVKKMVENDKKNKKEAKKPKTN